MSLSAYAHFNLTQSVDGSIVVHCNPLSAGVVLVGHCVVRSKPHGKTPHLKTYIKNMVDI